MRNIYLRAIQELEKGTQIVLATLWSTRGSAPQKAGASAIFSNRGLECGTLGGGVMEAHVQLQALLRLSSKQNHYGEFSLGSGIDDPEGAICGGSASVLLDANLNQSMAALQQMRDSFNEQHSGVMITILKWDEGCSAPLISRYWWEADTPLKDDIANNDYLGITKDELHEILVNKRIVSREVSVDTSGDAQNTRELNYPAKIMLFMESITSNARLVIVGAGHIGRALCHLGRLLDFEVTVLDNRPDVAHTLVDAHRVVVEDITKGFEYVNITTDTYIVIVTTNHNDDAQALRCCIGSVAGYVGMIGSRRKVCLMRENFIEKGWATANEFDRVCAPIGIDIGAQSVQEIAVSIAAELVQKRRYSECRAKSLRVWCVVLASGASRRMKRQKLLLPYKGKTIIGNVVDRAMESKANEVIVVVGDNGDGEAIASSLENLHPIILKNKNPQRGMLSSAQRGIVAIPAGVSAVMMLLGDHPMVRPQVMDMMIDALQKEDKDIVIPTYKGKRGHPILIDLKYRDEILALDGDRGLRELVDRYPDKVLELAVEYEDILTDIDTPKDYEDAIHVKRENR